MLDLAPVHAVLLGVHPREPALEARLNIPGAHAVHSKAVVFAGVPATRSLYEPAGHATHAKHVALAAAYAAQALAQLVLGRR